MAIPPRLRPNRTSQFTSQDSGFVSATHGRRPAGRRRDPQPGPSLPEFNLDEDSNGSLLHPAPEQAANSSQRPLLQLRDIECVKMLGEGGWAKVFLVQPHRDPGNFTTGHGSFLALKTTEKRTYRDTERNDDRADRKLAADKRNQEFRCLSALPWNPFVCGLVDAYTDPRNAYFMLEYASGGSFNDYLKDGKALSYEETDFYFANIVLGIEFLHTHGIVHRDIKDENILVGADGYLRITDFGLAQFANEGDCWDRFGTLPFMSYDVAKKKSNDSIEARYASDWWGAAVILFELLVERLPFAGKNCSAIAEDHELGRIQFRTEKPMRPKLEEFFRAAFHCDLSKRLGARTEPRAKQGSQVTTRLNVELREHEWFSALDWDRIEKRLEIAPHLPSAAIVQDWDDPPIPEQRKLPGLRLKRHWDNFDDEDVVAPVARPLKRRHVQSAPARIQVREQVQRAPPSPLDTAAGSR